MLTKAVRVADKLEMHIMVTVVAILLHVEARAPEKGIRLMADVTAALLAIVKHLRNRALQVEVSVAMLVKALLEMVDEPLTTKAK